jgi:hypothetical protein
MNSPADLLKQAEAARFLKRSLRTLALWREKDYGPPFLRVGGAVMYRFEDLRAFLDSNRVVPTKTQAVASQPAKEVIIPR